jgi:hypothetical protein
MPQFRNSYRFGLVVQVFALACATPAHSTTLTAACSATDGTVGPANLIAAVTQANTETGDTIVLDEGCLYTFTQKQNDWYGPNALPPIQSTMTIEGNGATLVASHTGDPTPATADAFRFFYVSGGWESPPGALTLHDLTLRGGYAKGGDAGGGGGAGMGGAIFNQGSLTLLSVTFTNNTAHGGNTNSTNPNGGGGGIGQDSQSNGGGFGGNTLPGAGMLSTGGAGAMNGGGGGGGFLSSANGQNATNLAGAGGGFGDLGGGPCTSCFTGTNGDGGEGGQSGLGGGSGGGFGAGGNVGPGLSSCGGGGGVGGGGGAGGGFCGGSGGFGGGASIQWSAAGFGGGAGAIASAAGFGGGANATLGGGIYYSGGGAGMGGAIFNQTGSATLVNVTAIGNAAIGGSSQGNPGSGLGAAIFDLNGSVIVSFSTFAQNIISGSNGASIAGGPGDATIYSLAYGNKVEDGSASFAFLGIANSIISGTLGGANDVTNNAVNGARTNYADLQFVGINIVGASLNNSLSDPNSISPLSTNAHLGSLSSYFNAPATLPISASSPAYNRVDPCNDAVGNPVTTDARGVARPQFGFCDIGAYEYDGDYIFASGFD